MFDIIFIYIYIANFSPMLAYVIKAFRILYNLILHFSYIFYGL